MILAIVGQKGGIGKTTTAAAIAQALEAKSKRNKVLLLDADGQGSASVIYGADPEGLTLYDVIKGTCRASEAIQKTEAGAIIPGSSELYGLDVELQREPGRDFLLAEALADLRKEYSHIIIDTAPGVGTCLIQALTAADGAIIPAVCDAQCYSGLNNTIETVEKVRKYCNKDLKLYGLLLTMYQPRTVLHRQFEELIQEEAKRRKIKVLKTCIRKGVAIQEAQALHKNIITYAPKSKPAEDYAELIKELKL